MKAKDHGSLNITMKLVNENDLRMVMGELICRKIRWLEEIAVVGRRPTTAKRFSKD